METVYCIYIYILCVYCPALNKVKKSFPLFLTCLNLPMSWGEGWDVWIELPKHRAPREVTAFSL